MRTGPFSDPTIVNIVNRYFIPLHLDTQDWTSARFGIDPGEENAYLLLLTPDLPEAPGPDFRFLNHLSEVLIPENTRRELLTFLEKHPGSKQIPQGVQDLRSRQDDESRKQLAVWFLEEGDSESASAILQEITQNQAELGLLRARALRLQGSFEEAQKHLRKAAPSVKVDLEALRLSMVTKDWPAARARIDWLTQRPKPSSEVYWWWGWLEHLQGQDEKAKQIWSQSLALFPREQDLYSQLIFFTLIRKNWELPENVDQVR